MRKNLSTFFVRANFSRDGRCHCNSRRLYNTGSHVRAVWGNDPNYIHWPMGHRMYTQVSRLSPIVAPCRRRKPTRCKNSDKTTKWKVPEKKKWEINFRQFCIFIYFFRLGLFGTACCFVVRCVIPAIWHRPSESRCGSGDLGLNGNFSYFGDVIIRCADHRILRSALVLSLPSRRCVRQRCNLPIPPSQ